MSGDGPHLCTFLKETFLFVCIDSQWVTEAFLQFLAFFVQIIRLVFFVTYCVAAFYNLNVSFGDETDNSSYLAGQKNKALRKDLTSITQLRFSPVRSFCPNRKQRSLNKSWNSSYLRVGWPILPGEMSCWI